MKPNTHPKQTKTFTLKTVRFHRPKILSNEMIDEPQAAVDVLFEQQGLDLDREHYILLALNAAVHPIGFKVCATGTLTACMVHPREVFKAAIALSAASIILIHNHPTGKLIPSGDDHKLAIRMNKAGEILGIPVLDHLLVDGEGGFVSYGVDHSERVSAL